MTNTLEKSQINKDNVNIKILVLYHAKTYLLKNDICVPIHCGRDVALKNIAYKTILKNDLKWMLKNLIGDNTGDNISYLNPKFNEMTGIYWAWKNYDKLGNPDYIGFVHYRTLFNLSLYPGYEENYLDTCGYTIQTLYPLLKEYKFIGTCHFKYKINSYEKYKELEVRGVDMVFYDTFLKILEEKYPNDYINFTNWNKQQETGTYKNMFITSKEEFFKYCEWIFPKLFELDKRMINYPYEKKGTTRDIAWLSEIITSFYFWRLGKTCKHKEICTYRPIIEQKASIFILLSKIFQYIKKHLFRIFLEFVIIISLLLFYFLNNI